VFTSVVVDVVFVFVDVGVGNDVSAFVTDVSGVFVDVCVVNDVCVVTGVVVDVSSVLTSSVFVVLPP
jgi:hypothetical protein